MTEPIEIAAFDAKTKLSELLRQVERGDQYLITRHGRPVARLVPVDATACARAPAAVVADIQAFSAGRHTLVEEILAWRDEGRR